MTLPAGFQMTRHAALAALLFFAGSALVVPALAQVTAVDPAVEEGARKDGTAEDVMVEEQREPSVAPVGEVTTLTEPCPRGTTAQPDGTCMMEGDALEEEEVVETDAPAPENDPS